MNHKISFLEFCEIIFLLTFKKIERAEGTSFKQEQEKHLELEVLENAIVSTVDEAVLREKNKRKKSKK